MKVACLELPAGVAGDCDNQKNIIQAKLDDLMLKADAKDPYDVVVLPELCMTGYGLTPKQCKEVAEPVGGGFCKWASELADKYQCGLVIGFPEKDVETGLIYNTACFVSPSDGVIHTYRKTHLYGDHEHSLFAKGTNLGETFRFRGVVCSLLICYDIEFSEPARICRLNGARAVFVPTANPHPATFVSKVLVPSRAIESCLFVYYANMTGVEKGACSYLQFCGLSAAASPEGLLVLSPTASLHVVSDEDDRNTYLADRQPHLYQSIVSPKSKSKL
eukprot:TRINITY_DN14030_c0_g2_i1.p1 TRINITY_DN14030_c0_g2~~TRINITY_DN14030_c0_g2_i1.p1  ORF type:complete len:275 (+),score=24.58 TRINITY_DN14030_c0_g2_i1:61-885(+)